MSWTSRLGNLGRFSPFTRSPQQAGSSKVSDADFSYITTEDLRRHQAEGGDVLDAGERETDVIVLKKQKIEIPLHFPVDSIANGVLTVGHVRRGAAKRTDTNDPDRIKLLYRGKNLKDDGRTCKAEGLQNGSNIMCMIADVDASASGSEDEGDGEAEDDDQSNSQSNDTPKKKRNRGKKSKKKNKRDTRLMGSTASSPAPSTPLTPLDKLNALQAKLDEFAPQVEQYKKSPPTEPAKKQFEHKRLSETILTQVLLKLDAVETEGEPEARARRKELVTETQRVLTDLDAAAKL